MRCENCSKFLTECSPVPGSTKCQQEREFYVYEPGDTMGGMVIRARSPKQAKFRFSEMLTRMKEAPRSLRSIEAVKVVWSPKRQQWEDENGIPTRHMK